jgi:hypothetical protein
MMYRQETALRLLPQLLMLLSLVQCFVVPKYKLCVPDKGVQV